MISSPSCSAVVALALYLQAACVAPSYTIVVRADGAFRLESTAEHLREWHGGGDGSSRAVRVDAETGSTDGWGGAHAHVALAESDSYDDATAPFPAPSARVVIADVLANFEADGRPPRRPPFSRVPDDASFAAAESLFGRLVLNV